MELTVAAATINSTGEVVKQAPVSAVAPAPAAPTPWSSGVFGFKPLYSNTLTSGDDAAWVMLTVIVFGVTPSPRMFFA